jgi:hypothetical protein
LERKQIKKITQYRKERQTDIPTAQYKNKQKKKDIKKVLTSSINNQSASLSLLLTY